MYKTKIFFTAAYGGKGKYQEYYDMVVRSIQKNDVELIATELGNYKTVLSKSDLKKVRSEREEHYLAIKKGIAWADLVILELSHESFQVGHEATLAMLDKKPVLGLSIHRDWSETIINPFFIGAKYNKYFIDEIIRDFIEKNNVEKLTERFNLFLSKKQLTRLEKNAKENGMNMSEYIRKKL